jgi:hypothetical protein
MASKGVEGLQILIRIAEGDDNFAGAVALLDMDPAPRV